MTDRDENLFEAAEPPPWENQGGRQRMRSLRFSARVRGVAGRLRAQSAYSQRAQM